MVVVQPFLQGLDWYPEKNKATTFSGRDKAVGCLLAELLLPPEKLQQTKEPFVRLAEQRRQQAQRNEAEARRRDREFDHIRVGDNAQDAEQRRKEAAEAQMHAVNIAVKRQDGQNLLAWANSIQSELKREHEKWSQEPRNCPYMWAAYGEFRQILSSVGAYKHQRVFNFAKMKLCKDSGSSEESISFLAGLFFHKKYQRSYSHNSVHSGWLPSMLQKEEPGMWMLLLTVASVHICRMRSAIEDTLKDPTLAEGVRKEAQTRSSKLANLTTVDNVKKHLLARVESQTATRQQKTPLYLLPLYIAGSWMLCAVTEGLKKNQERLEWWAPTCPVEANNLLQTLPADGPEGCDPNAAALTFFFKESQLYPRDDNAAAADGVGGESGAVSLMEQQQNALDDGQVQDMEDAMEVDAGATYEERLQPAEEVPEPTISSSNMPPPRVARQDTTLAQMVRNLASCKAHMESYVDGGSKQIS